MSQEISGVIVGDGTIYSSPTTQLDTALSTSSTNAVQNKVITAALDAKQNTLTFDTTPTANSTNPVTSGGLKTALDAKQNTLTFDTTPTANSTNPVTSGGLKTALDAISGGDLNSILPKTAAAHNSVVRGKDLTSYESSGGMSDAIKAGTFDDIFPGDYIIKSVTINGKTYSSVKWIVMDCDYHYKRGYGSWTDSTGATTSNYAVHHVLLMPEHYLLTAYMNSTNTTAGGYQGSYMFKTIIPKVNTGVVNAFGKAHVLMHDEILTNAVNTSAASMIGSGWTGSSYWSWGTDGKTDGTYPWRHDIQCNIPNQAMLYGHAPCASSGFDTGECTKQLAYFRYSQNFDSSYYCWLRDVSSTASFARAFGNCGASTVSASCVEGVLPYFLYH